VDGGKWIQVYVRVKWAYTHTCGANTRAHTVLVAESVHFVVAPIGLDFAYGAHDLLLLRRQRRSRAVVAASAATAARIAAAAAASALASAATCVVCGSGCFCENDKA
jgi:hypothetical protein